MLRTIDIQNVALIDNLSIDFSSNFNVLSGETGAGKSIIIDSLNFVIGGKTSKKLIRQGCNFMKVTACFYAPFNSKICSLLKELDIDFDDEIVLSRKMSLDGKGDLRVNGNIVPLSLFKKISIFLVDIHGQHEHQKILEDKNHLDILDNFMVDKTILNEYVVLYDELKEINKDIKELNGSTSNQERMLELLDYQINEIENANLQLGEDETLEQRKLLMQNAGKIYDSLNDSFVELDSEGNVASHLKKASNLVNNLVKFDNSFSNIVERLDNLKFEVMDLVSNIKEKKEECDFNEYEFEQVDERLDKIKSIKKKYGATLEEVFKFLDDSRKEYDKIKNSKELLLNKISKKNKLLEDIYNVSLKLTNERKKIAETFEKKTNIELSQLGMKNARFRVEFLQMPSLENIEEQLSMSGADKVRFMFSANAGQDLKPLSEIISGGEASRFMLAVKNILAEYDDINLMVFDEIDTGISGEMGYKVACKLANISRKHQVISVSHLPQICAMADKNILVSKFLNNGNTFVSTKDLVDKDLLSEISRLSGGISESEISLSHAKELKQRCDDYKKSISKES